MNVLASSLGSSGVFIVQIKTEIVEFWANERPKNCAPLD